MYYTIRLCGIVCPQEPEAMDKRGYYSVESGWRTPSIMESPVWWSEMRGDICLYAVFSALEVSAMLKGRQIPTASPGEALSRQVRNRYGVAGLQRLGKRGSHPA